MDKNKIILLGNPLLRQISKPVATYEFGTPELMQLEHELFDMLEAEKGLGLGHSFIFSKMGLAFSRRRT